MIPEKLLRRLQDGLGSTEEERIRKRVAHMKSLNERLERQIKSCVLDENTLNKRCTL